MHPYPMSLIRRNKKISVFLVKGLKILGRVGTHRFFSGIKSNFMHFERQNAFQMHKIIFFTENLKKSLVSPVN